MISPGSTAGLRRLAGDCKFAGEGLIAATSTAMARLVRMRY